MSLGSFGRIGCPLVLLLGLSCAHAGLRVEQVQLLAPAADNLLHEGDVLQTAAGRDGTVFPLDSALDWMIVEGDVMPSGPVKLALVRGGKTIDVELAAGQVGLVVAAQPPPPAAAALEAAITQLRHAMLSGTPQQLAAALAGLDEASAFQRTPQRRIALVSLATDAATQLSRIEDRASRWSRAGLSPDVRWPSEASAWARLGYAKARARGDINEAIQATKRGTDYLAKTAPDSLAYADALGWLARLEAVIKDLQSARTHAEMAVAIAARCNRCVSHVRAMHTLAMMQTALDQPEQAIETCKTAIGQLDALSDAPKLLLYDLLNSMAAAQQRLGRFDAAAASNDRVIASMRSDPQIDDLAMVSPLNLQGILAYSLGNAASAIAAWEAAISIAKRVEPDSFTEYNPTVNLAELLMTRGDLDGARERFRRGLSILDKLGYRGLMISRARFNLGRVESSAGQYERAKQEIETGIAMAEEIAPGGLTSAQGWVQLTALDVAASDLAGAEQAIGKALAISQSLPKDCACKVPTLIEAGWLDLRLGRHADARSRFESARALLDARYGPLDRAEVSHGLGQALLAQGEFTAAEAALDDAIELLRRYAPSSASLAQVLFARGRLLGKTNAPDGARDALCEATTVLDDSSERIGGDSIALAQFRTQYADVYRACVEAELGRGRVQRAFEVLDRSRARSFLDALVQHPPAPGADGAEALANEWLSLREQYDAVLQMLGADQVSAVQGEQLRVTLDAKAQQRRQAADKLRRADPLLGALVDRHGPSIASIQSALPERSALLSYAVGDAGGRIFLLTKTTLQVRDLPVGEAALRSRVAELRALVAGRREQDSQAIEALTRSLYAALIAPFEEQLGAATQRLLISPEGALHDLPFALLQDPRGRYLVERFSIAIVDSAASFAALQARQRTSAEITLGVAPTLEQTQVSGTAWDGYGTLPPLPAARDEVAQLVARAPDHSRALIGSAATEAAVREWAPTAGILHFATHAIFDASRPMDSMLVLQPDAGVAGGAPDPRRDGALHMWEVLGELPLRARLVVLSGCETGRGGELRGEGLIGFTRAFQLAGADAVVASLWPLQDRGAQRLMSHFYDELALGADPASALRSAMLRRLRDSAPGADGALRGVGGLSHAGSAASARVHPFEWAAFQAYGSSFAPKQAGSR